MNIEILNKVGFSEKLFSYNEGYLIASKLGYFFSHKDSNAKSYKDIRSGYYSSQIDAAIVYPTKEEAENHLQYSQQKTYGSSIKPLSEFVREQIIDGEVFFLRKGVEVGKIIFR